MVILLMMKWVIIPALILMVLPTPASADIVEWTDTAGVTHYTNLKGAVPAQQPVQIVVDEQVWVPHGSAAPAVKEDPVAPPEPPPDPGDEVLRAYLAGLQSGAGGNVNAGGSVYISGPLAVTISPTPYGSYGLPAYGWFWPGYYSVWPTSLIGRHHGPIHDRLGHGFHARLSISQRFFGPAGPPPFGAAGPPPFGAAGPPPFGAAGPPPVGAVGGPRHGFSGSPFLR